MKWPVKYVVFLLLFLQLIVKIFPGYVGKDVLVKIKGSSHTPYPNE